MRFFGKNLLKNLPKRLTALALCGGLAAACGTSAGALGASVSGSIPLLAKKGTPYSCMVCLSGGSAPATALKFTVEWDAAKLKLEDYGNYLTNEEDTDGLPGNLNITQVGEGRLSVVWYDLEAKNAFDPEVPYLMALDFTAASDFDTATLTVSGLQMVQEVGTTGKGTEVNADGVELYWRSEATVPGDVNGDGKVNATDCIQICDIVNETADQYNYLAADVNGDGMVNANDCIQICEIVNDDTVGESGLVLVKCE